MSPSGSFARATISTWGTRDSLTISSAETLTAASSGATTHKAGSNPAARASSSAARQLSLAAQGSGLRGPIGPRSTSRPGSASASADPASSQSDRCSKTGLAGSAASRTLASANAAARVPLMSSAAWRLGSTSSRSSGVAVSTATIPIACLPSTRTVRPPRKAAIALRIGELALKSRSRRSAGHGPKGVPNSGKAPAPHVPQGVQRAWARPTYGRAGGRGRSWSSPVSGSSTR